MEIIPQISKKSKMPVYIQLYHYVKEDVMHGRLSAHSRLPSVRDWSRQLGVSRTTIENAYTQLVAEGYIYSKPQAGYYVSAFEGTLGHAHRDVQSIKADEKASGIVYDFKSEYVEACNFNVMNWKKHIGDVIVFQSTSLYHHADLQGETALREAIAQYVYRTRGVSTVPDDIVVGAGVQPLLEVLARVMADKIDHGIGVEDPGFNRAKHVFERNNYDVMPIEISSAGLDVSHLYKSGKRLCYVSPSHQFPTGAVMRLDARSRLISWADEMDGYIIEDDYNSELRYEGKPIPAMKSLDQKDRVIYLGSFSTVLIPSVRISFVILPQQLRNPYLMEQFKGAPMVSKLEQLALANMLTTGVFEKHIRKIRKNYAKKNEFTLQQIYSKLGELVEIIGMNSGLNVLLRMKYPVNEAEMLLFLARQGVLIGGMSEYRIVKSIESVLILSFRGIDTKDIDPGISRLSDLLHRYIEIEEKNKQQGV